MSVTTTDNARVYQVLADYELYHSQPSNAEARPAPEPERPTQPRPDNPAGWEDRWRRVPAYRPVVNQLDEQRNTYTSAIEQNFVRVMFGGVFMMASASKLWRMTGGRVNSDFFKHKIGGEW